MPGVEIRWSFAEALYYGFYSKRDLLAFFFARLIRSWRWYMYACMLVSQVLPTVRQLAGIATKDYRREKGGRGARQQRGGGRGNGGGRSEGRGRSNDGFRGRGGGGGRGGEREGGGRGDDGGGGGGKKKDVVLKAKQFDIVFLDPPTWSKSTHGAVDLVRDYQVPLCAAFFLLVFLYPQMEG